MILIVYFSTFTDPSLTYMINFGEKNMSITRFIKTSKTKIFHKTDLYEISWCITLRDNVLNDREIQVL